MLRLQPKPSPEKPITLDSESMLPKATFPKRTRTETIGYSNSLHITQLQMPESVGAYFVVRGKKKNDFKPMKWKRRFPLDSGILSDAIAIWMGS